MKNRKVFSVIIFTFISCLALSYGNNASADSVPYFTLDAASYLSGEVMEVNVYHTEQLEGKKYLEILWTDTGNIIYRTEFEQTECLIPAPAKAGNYTIRLVLENEELIKRFTVTESGAATCVLHGKVSRNNTGEVLGILLYWEGTSGKEYYIKRIEADGTSTSYGPIRLTNWIDIDIEPSTSYTYSVSDGTLTSNLVIMDLTEFTPSEYVKNYNVGVIELRIGMPYMTVNNQSEPIDPQNSNVVPVLQQGRVMLPIRALVEKMGGTVTWKSESRSVLISAWNQDVEIPIGSNTISVNGEPREFDAPAYVEEGRTRVPVRHLESLGCEVNWISETKSVLIRYHMDAELEH